METTRHLSHRDELLAWFGAGGAAAAWLVHFGVGYLLSEAACSTGEGTGAIEPLTVGLTVALGVVAAGSGLAALLVWRRAGSGALPDPRGRVRWLGKAGMIAAGIFLFTIVLEGVQVLPLSCEAG